MARSKRGSGGGQARAPADEVRQNSDLKEFAVRLSGLVVDVNRLIHAVSTRTERDRFLSSFDDAHRKLRTLASREMLTQVSNVGNETAAKWFPATLGIVRDLCGEVSRIVRGQPTSEDSPPSWVNIERIQELLVDLKQRANSLQDELPFAKPARFFFVHDLPVFANDARDAEAIAQRIGSTVANSPPREATGDELRKTHGGLLTHYLEKWRPLSAEAARDWAHNGREAIRAAVTAGWLSVSEIDDSAIGGQAYELAHRFHLGAPFLADLIKPAVTTNTRWGGLRIGDALHNLNLLADTTPGQGSVVGFPDIIRALPNQLRKVAQAIVNNRGVVGRRAITLAIGILEPGGTHSLQELYTVWNRDRSKQDRFKMLLGDTLGTLGALYARAKDKDCSAGDFVLSLNGFASEWESAIADSEATGGERLPPKPTVAENSGQRETEARAIVWKRLKKCEQQAYLAFQLVASNKGGNLEDRVAWDEPKNKEFPESQSDLGELQGYELPSYETFTTHLSHARSALKELKYEKGKRRPRRGVVNHDEIENVSRDESE